MFDLVINSQPAVSSGRLCANSRRRTRLSLGNLAIVPPSKPSGKIFNIDYLKTDISLLQSLLEVKVWEMIAYVQKVWEAF